MIRVTDTDGDVWYIPDHRIYYVRIKDHEDNKHFVSVAVEGETTLQFAIDDDEFHQLNQTLTSDL